MSPLDYIDIVFDGPPGPEAGRFVEVEDARGESIRVGEWIDRGNGTWALRIAAPGTAQTHGDDAKAWRVPLWNAINDYVRACGGNPDGHVFGNAARMDAVVAVERVIESLLPASDAALCRRCVDCEGSPHHWIEDPEDGVITDWACRHCEARGVTCPECDGEGTSGISANEDEACELCGGDGVLEAAPRKLVVASSAQAELAGVEDRERERAIALIEALEAELRAADKPGLPHAVVALQEAKARIAGPRRSSLTKLTPEHGGSGSASSSEGEKPEPVTEGEPQ